MNIPAPAPLGRVPTLAVAAPFGSIDLEQLTAAKAAGRAPIFVHRLGDDKARQLRGPRECREETVAALERAGWAGAWGLGGVCRSMDDAAQFAVAGFTWFTLDLSDHLEASASAMSLDDLDTAIVALEDRGAFPLGWHEAYLENGSVAGVTFTDESLARVAVRFGVALAEAEQMAQAIRVSSSERGDLPDLEISLGNAHFPTSAEDLAFVTAECTRRGLIHGGVTRYAPSLGTRFEPGGDATSEPPAILRDLLQICPATAILSIPETLAANASASACHWNAEHASWLWWLRRLATTDPALFRKWLAEARDAFPSAKTGWNISTSEDDVRFLPEVPDDALVPTFLETVQGRQLLLVTWQDVADRLGPEVAPPVALG